MASDNEGRLARIETHLEYIRGSLDTWDERCSAHRAAVARDVARDISTLRDGAEFAASLRWLLVLSAKLIGIGAAIAGIVKVALALG